MATHTHYEWARMIITRRLEELEYTPREPAEYYHPEDILDMVIGPIEDLLKFSRFDIQTIRESSCIVCSYFSKKLKRRIVINESVDIYEYSTMEEIARTIAGLEVECRTLEDKIAINSYVATSIPHQIEEV